MRRGPTFPKRRRFAAAVLSFAPTMALLGAKRPQNGAWQFVVITLWAILALPAFEVLLRGRGEALAERVDGIRSVNRDVVVAAAIHRIGARERRLY